jgi:hypothetical protein
MKPIYIYKRRNQQPRGSIGNKNNRNKRDQAGENIYIINPKAGSPPWNVPLSPKLKTTLEAIVTDHYIVSRDLK